MGTGRQHFQEELHALEMQALGGIDLVVATLDRTLEALRSEGAVDGLVSAYFRLGLDQDVQAPSDRSLAKKVHVNDVVVVDLQRDWSQIFSGFRPSLRTALRNKCNGIDVQASDDCGVPFHLHRKHDAGGSARELFL